MQKELENIKLKMADFEEYIETLEDQVANSAPQKTNYDNDA